MIPLLNNILPIVQALMLLATIAGGALVFRNSKRAAIVQIQSETIDALQRQIDTIKADQTTLQKENAHLEYVIETIAAALKQKNILISVNGELVTIEDGSGQSIVRRSQKKPEAS